MNETKSPFGRVLTAMVTPLDGHDGVDVKLAGRLAGVLTRDGWNDGLVLNGTTGESGTTTDREKIDIVTAVRNSVRDDISVIAGVGSADTRHSVAMARAAAAAGADGLMVVAPYYSRPSQQGVLEHFRAIADATDLPVMLYDIPKRTGVSISLETLIRAAEHQNIVALKDASGDVAAASQVISHTDLWCYSGDDILNLPLCSLGYVGVVSVIGHVVADRLRMLVDFVDDGDLKSARATHNGLLRLCTGMFRAPGAASAKTALSILGLPCGGVRSPLAGLTSDERRLLAEDLHASGVGQLAVQ